jgi:hypothetical protein
VAGREHITALPTSKPPGDYEDNLDVSTTSTGAGIRNMLCWQAMSRISAAISVVWAVVGDGYLDLGEVRLDLLLLACARRSF